MELPLCSRDAELAVLTGDREIKRTVSSPLPDGHEVRHDSLRSGSSHNRKGQPVELGWNHELNALVPWARCVFLRSYPI